MMSLAAAILQPQAIRREAPDTFAALAEDLARLVALIAEDAAAEGPVTGAAEAAMAASGVTLAASIQPRRAAAEARLRARFPAVRGLFEGLMGDAEAAIDRPDRILSLVRRILGLARTATRATTLPVLRRELEFLRALVEDDLGLNPAMLGDIIAAFLAEWGARLGAAPEPADAAGRRRLRLTRAVLGRLQLRAALLRPPALDMEPLARLLSNLLKRGGIADALREVDCALEGIEASLDAGRAAGRAMAVTTEERGVVPLKNAAEYSYYASWLMADEDLPLIGLSDLKDARGFLEQLRTSTKSVESYFRDTVFTDGERVALADTTGIDEPSREVLLPILGAVNRGMQAREILAFSIEESFRSEYGLPDELLKLRDSFGEDQEMFLFNRRIMEHVFAGKIDRLPKGSRLFRHGFGHAFWWDFLNPGLVGYPRNQVFVTGDRRLVMCDDIPLTAGVDLRWHDAPIFKGDPILYGTWFSYDHVSPPFCEVWAQVWTICGECAKAIWHLAKVQPGHEAQGAVIGTVELVETIQQILFGKPLSAYFLERSAFLRWCGKMLDSVFGLKGISTLATSFQGRQTEAPNEKFYFWATVFLGDVIRNKEPIAITNLVRDAAIGFVALLAAGGPRDEPSTLPRNPPRNHLKQRGWVRLSDRLFAMLLISLYPRDNYSIFVWRGDGPTAEVMAGHWLGGSAGLGLVAGMAGSLAAQINAWGEDFGRFFKSGALSAGKMFLLYWFYHYYYKENATDDGRYRPGSGSFRGYPDKDLVASPYLLPFPGGTAQYTGQANLGFWSHNLLNTPTNVYAYDFGHDFRTPVACARAGVVWRFSEGFTDGTTANPNTLVIRHATIDPKHDDFGTGPVQTYSVYLHLAQNGVTNAPLFGGTPPVQESVTAGAGTPVAQGDLIALAGDTGMSFHNHLHLHVVPDDGTGQPSTAFCIPFVFQDAPGDGVLKSTTWYRSGNR